MTENPIALDVEEILHLAMSAIRSGDHGAALSQLKQGAARFPDDARIVYLLGAEHAQIGLFDRAEAEVSRAVELDPSLIIARFQLGLMQMTQGRPEDARETWAALDQLPPTHGLRLFKQGLDAMSRDRFAEARNLIQRGIDANDFSQELNNDMRNVLSRIPAEGDDTTINAGESSALWFNAYRDTDQSH